MNIYEVRQLWGNPQIGKGSRVSGSISLQIKQRMTGVDRVIDRSHVDLKARIETDFVSSQAAQLQYVPPNLLLSSHSKVTMPTIQPPCYLLSSQEK